MRTLDEAITDCENIIDRNKEIRQWLVELKARRMAMLKVFSEYYSCSGECRKVLTEMSAAYYESLEQNNGVKES